MMPTKINGAVTIKGYGDIADLEAVRGNDGALYSAWRPNWRERIFVALGLPVCVGVLSQRQPPITVIVGVDLIPRAAASRDGGQ